MDDSSAVRNEAAESSTLTLELLLAVLSLLLLRLLAVSAALSPCSTASVAPAPDAVVLPLPLTTADELVANCTTRSATVGAVSVRFTPGDSVLSLP